MGACMVASLLLTMVMADSQVSSQPEYRLELHRDCVLWGDFVYVAVLVSNDQTVPLEVHGDVSANIDIAVVNLDTKQRISYKDVMKTAGHPRTKKIVGPGESCLAGKVAIQVPGPFDSTNTFWKPFEKGGELQLVVDVTQGRQSTTLTMTKKIKIRPRPKDETIWLASQFQELDQLLSPVDKKAFLQIRYPAERFLAVMRIRRFKTQFETPPPIPEILQEHVHRLSAGSLRNGVMLVRFMEEIAEQPPSREKLEWVGEFIDWLHELNPVEQVFLLQEARPMVNNAIQEIRELSLTPKETAKCNTIQNMIQNKDPLFRHAVDAWIPAAAK